MHDIKIQRLTAAIAAAFLLLGASPVVSGLQAASGHDLLPIAQMTDPAVDYGDDRDDDGFPWGLLGLLGLIGLAGLKGKDNDRRVHHEDTTAVRARPEGPAAPDTTVRDNPNRPRPEGPAGPDTTRRDPNRPRT